MIILDATTLSLEVLLAASGTLPLTAGYQEMGAATPATPRFKSNQLNTNGTTAVTLVAAPSSGKTHRVEHASCLNDSGSAATVTFRLNSSGTYRKIFKVTLADGDNLVYDGHTFHLFDLDGKVKTSGSSSGSGGYDTIQDEGSDLFQRTVLNFIGPGVLAEDDSGSSRTNVTVDSSKFEIVFAYGDASPLAIGTLPANKIVESVAVYITEAFDGSGAALSVGYTGAVTALMDTTDNDPTQLCTFTTTPGVSYGTDKNLVIAITPGSGPTAGEGLVVVKYQL